MAWEPLVEWDKPGDHIFETGVDRGMLYVQDTDGRYQKGVPWSGLISVEEKHTGGEADDLFADDVKYMSVRRNENFEYTLKAYTYPEEFSVCIGEYELVNGIYIAQQEHRPFGFCYRSRIGNEYDSTDFGYKLHLIYGCIAQPTSRTFNTMNDGIEATVFSWDVNCDPMRASAYRPIAEIVIDTYRVKTELNEAVYNYMTGVTKDQLETDKEFEGVDWDLYQKYIGLLKIDTLEQQLYGVKPNDDYPEGLEPSLPTVYSILNSFYSYSIYIRRPIEADDSDLGSTGYDPDAPSDDPDDDDE